MARNPDRALDWWLAHPGELDEFLRSWFEYAFVTSSLDDADLPGLQALHAETVAALEGFAAVASPGSKRDMAQCLAAVTATLEAIDDDEFLARINGPERAGMRRGLPSLAGYGKGVEIVGQGGALRVPLAGGGLLRIDPPYCEP